MSEASKAVFLSYASEDAVAARHICQALRAAGIEVWFDQRELRGGDVWDAAIRQQIRTCALIILVISRTTHARDEGYFRLEWKLAVDRSHLMSKTRPFLVPVVIDDTPEDDQVPDRLRDVQWTRRAGGEAPPAFAARIARLLCADARSAPRAGEAVPAEAGGQAQALRQEVRSRARAMAPASRSRAPAAGIRSSTRRTGSGTWNSICRRRCGCRGSCA